METSGENRDASEENLQNIAIIADPPDDYEMNEPDGSDTLNDTVIGSFSEAESPQSC